MDVLFLKTWTKGFYVCVWPRMMILSDLKHIPEIRKV